MACKGSTHTLIWTTNKGWWKKKKKERQKEGGAERQRDCCMYWNLYSTHCFQEYNLNPIHLRSFLMFLLLHFCFSKKKKKNRCTSLCASVYCYHCYCAWRSPAAQRTTSSAPSLSSHRSSGGGRTGATGWGGTESHTWWMDYCPLWPWYLQQVTRQNENEKLFSLFVQEH